MSLVIRLATKLFMKLFKKTPLFKKLKTAFTLYMLGVLTAVISGLAVAGLALFCKKRPGTVAKLLHRSK